MCSLEQALPYVALAVLCPSAYERMARAKVGQLLGASSATIMPHRDDHAQEADR